jgi:hypothetical protein
MMKLPEKLQDKWWRLNHLYKIMDKGGNLVTFRPNYMQLKHISERRGHRYNYILKARQFGFTTMYCIDLLDEALWVPGMSCAIIGHERQATEDIFNIIKRAFTNLPDELRPKTKTDTLREYEFTHRFDGAILDSRIYSALKVRSGTVQNLHITESAFNKDRQELVAGSKQAVPLHGRISEETTGNGMEGFYDAYMTARAKDNPTEMDYRTYFYPWVLNPEYKLQGTIEEYTPEELKIKEIAMNEYKIPLSDGQLLWRRWKKDELSSNNIGFGMSADQLFKQEYPLTILEAFQSGAGSVFDLEKLESISPQKGLTEAEIRDKYMIMYRNDEEIVSHYMVAVQDLLRRGVTIWELPEAGQEYVSGCDPSDGQGSDFGVIDIWTRTRTMDEKKKQVAQFYGKLLPDDLAELIKDVCTFYNKAFAGVENNLLTTISHLVKIYDNYFSTVSIDEKTQKRTKKIGYRTSAKSREFMIDEYLIDFESGDLVIRSSVTLAEMKTFVKKQMAGGRYKREHADGKHDDALFAGFISNQMAKYNKPQARVFSQKPEGL